MQIGRIGGRNLNILAFCYVLLESLDRRFIRNFWESYDLLIGNS